MKKNLKNKAGEKLEIATLGAGCFWCVEAVFQRLEGVLSITSGYSGGAIKNPAYREICSGQTGHAEVAQLMFDPEVISFGELLDVFWHTHDPTTLNRQGADAGTQYRSVIFYHSETQKNIAEESMKEADASDLWPEPIVTEVSPFSNFYMAEANHQDYYNQNPNQPYCTFVISPKVQKLQKAFKDKLKTS